MKTFQFRHLLYGFLILGFGLFSFSCAPEKPSDAGNSGNSGNVDPSLWHHIRIQVQDLSQKDSSQKDSSQKVSSRVPLGTVNDIQKIAVDIRGENHVYYTGEPLLKEEEGWIGEFDLPQNVLLTFTARAFNSSSREIFQGATSKVLSEQDQSISITLYPIDDGTPLDLPQILKIIKPIKMNVGESEVIQATIGGSGWLDWAFSADQRGGAFDPDLGTLYFGNNP